MIAPKEVEAGCWRLSMQGWPLMLGDPLTSVTSSRCDKMSALRALVHISYTETNPPKKGELGGPPEEKEHKE